MPMDNRPEPDGRLQVVGRGLHGAGFVWLVIILAACSSLAIYLVALVLPYGLFAHVGHAPTGFPQIAERKPLPAALFLLAFVTLFCHYALAYVTCRLYPARRLVPAIIIFGLAMALLLSFTYPVGAGDVGDYVSQGEILAFSGANPLVTPAATVPGVVFARYAVAPNSVSIYGPVWLWIGGLVVGALGRESLALNVLGFKAVAIASYLGLALLVYAILHRRHPARAPAGVLFFAWNPLVLYEFAANAHNDATMMAFAVLGILLWTLDRPLLMVAALTLSVLVKVPSAPLIPLLLLAASRRRRPGRASAMTLVAGGLVALVIAGLAYLSLPGARLGLDHLSGHAGIFTHSLPAIVKLVLQLGGIEETVAETVARSGALVALGVFYAVQLRRTWKRPSGTIQHAFDFTLFLLLFAVPWFQPWYVTWLVALAALSPRPDAHSQAGLFSFTVLISYVIYGFLWFWIIPVANWGNCLGINLMAVGTSYLAPWSYAAWLWLRAKRTATGS